MSTRALWAAVVGAVICAACAACSATIPPAIVPQPNPAFEPLTAALQSYVDRTQPFRTRQNALAEALPSLRPDATPGDIFTPPVADEIRRTFQKAFNSAQRDLILDELAEQNQALPNAPAPAAVNQRLDAPRLPPRLSAMLPPLPRQLEYDVAARTLILRDVDADVVVDVIHGALPEATLAPPREAAAAPQPPGAISPLPMPEIRGGTVFAAMGDSGSGDGPQQAVAQALLTYFTTARRFPFVIMLGDNLYDDDYMNEFLIPYKPLLDRGVKFYAALGNHDRDLEIHFKPFNMGGADRYAFDEGNARFAVLNSNHPRDPGQIAWLNAAYADAGDKWRIAFFHHPLYSSGRHRRQARRAIRPALEQPLVDNRVNVVFAGHDHLYARIKPQHGIQYFVSGGGGQSLYDYHPSELDEVGLSEHHFMVLEIAGDRMFFEAITHAQALIDCGVIYRTPAAASKKIDAAAATWLADCEAARAFPRTTALRHQ